MIGCTPSRAEGEAHPPPTFLEAAKQGTGLRITLLRTRSRRRSLRSGPTSCTPLAKWPRTDHPPWGTRAEHTSARRGAKPPSARAPSQLAGASDASKVRGLPSNLSPSWHRAPDSSAPPVRALVVCSDEGRQNVPAPRSHPRPRLSPPRPRCRSSMEYSSPRRAPPSSRPPLATGTLPGTGPRGATTVRRAPAPAPRFQKGSPRKRFERRNDPAPPPRPALQMLTPATRWALPPTWTVSPRTSRPSAPRRPP